MTHPRDYNDLLLSQFHSICWFMIVKVGCSRCGESLAVALNAVRKVAALGNGCGQMVAVGDGCVLLFYMKSNTLRSL